MLGKSIRPDRFIDELVDGPAARLIPHFNGKFSLLGHSAGGQFAARYAVMHPRRLDQVILGAPSTYPMPDDALAWPYGIAHTSANVLQRPAAGKSALKEAGSDFMPEAENWLFLATSAAVTVLVGSKDMEKRPPAPGQDGSTRLARAKAWVAAMRHLTASHGKTPGADLVIVDGLDHDETAIAVPAPKIFVQKWTATR